MKAVTLKPDIVNDVIAKKRILTEDDTKVFDSTLTKRILLLHERLKSIINDYFSLDGALQLNSLIDYIASSPDVCLLCNKDSSIESVPCSSCNVLYHLNCLKLKSAPQDWNCSNCYKNVLRI